MHKISLHSRISHSTQLLLNGMKRNLAMGWSCKLCIDMGLFDLSIMFVDRDFILMCFVL
jgi:hypothetical protein